LLLAASSARAVTILNDGAVHNFNGVTDQLDIFDGAGSVPTTVNVQTGAVVGGTATSFSVNVRDNSIFNMSGGSLFDELFLFNNASANLSGGSIGDDLTPDNNSTVNVTSVTVKDDVEGHGSSMMTIQDGNFDEDVESLDSAVITINGGMFQTGADAANVLASGNSTININGGSFGTGSTPSGGGINVVDNAVINIHGGNIAKQTTGLSAAGNGVINIYGLGDQPTSMNTSGNGLINVYGGLTDLAASGSGLYQLLGGGSQLTSIHTNGTISLFIRGSSFALNGAAKSGLLTSIGGNLTGVLADGSTLNVSLTRGSLVPAQTIFLLPVPEPGTMGLASFAVASCLGFVGRRRISP
jgi:hypothetical protein